jgi:hypothetical protein
VCVCVCARAHACVFRCVRVYVRGYRLVCGVRGVRGVRVCVCTHRGPHSQGLLEGRVNPLQPTQLRESEREKKKKNKDKTKKKVREIAEKEKGPVKRERER